MSKEEIRVVVISALKEIQELSGRAWCDLEDADQPIGKLAGFDSLAGIETAIAIEQKVGCELKCDEVFADGKKAFTLSDVCSQIAKVVSSTEAT